jgi:8-oxo-dGTP pyrophosphatase MutT (NUDIX family)
MATDDSVVELAVILFVLPDGKLVLQRRSKDASRAPGKLGFFGGHVDKGESSMEGLLREIAEETSLDPKGLKIDLIHNFILPVTQNYPRDRRFYVYKAPIQDLNFAVYEGDRAEAYTRATLRERRDLSEVIEYTLKNTTEELQWR